MSSRLTAATALICLMAFSPPALAGTRTARDLAAELATSPIAGNSAKGVRLAVTSLSGPVVEEGDSVRFKVAANRDGYAHLYVLSASGRLQVWMENVPVAAGEPLIFPTSREVTITAEAPLGKDRIVALLTRKRLDGFGGRRTTTRPTDVDMDLEEFQHAVEAMLTENDENAWAWARTSVRVAE